MWKAALFAVAAALAPVGAAAQDSVEMNFILNWIAGGDHAPYYYAKSKGWYEDAGIDLNISQGQGSAMAAQRAGIGSSDLGLADLGTALIARGKGADFKVVMNIYANSPYGMYWLKSSGIDGPKDFPGHTIGNPPSDAARAMFPALAKAVGIDPDSVEWVNVKPNAKLAGLKSGAFDITTSFYNIHYIFKRELGDNMGFFRWKKYGINPYGNSILVNSDFLQKHEKAVEDFVQTTQRAFATCVRKPEPCVHALVDANTGLTFENELKNWNLVVELITDKTSTTKGLGYFKESRLKSDYKLTDTYFDIEQPFDITDVVTNKYLDTSITVPTPES